MLLALTTVIGYMIALGAVGFTIMHFIKKDVHAHDSETIDPIPDEKF
ncbi:hypothetical protein [Planomicrobium sp. YIM 101495]|nr:hypothetical protein [Planomicrobium sp. YIM 101495]MTD32085.1 hypothetical protein [Planomicrobium sp. YIM 101495]